MGLRGPSPTPSRILKLRGSWLSKVRGEEPQPSARAPKTPKDLTPDERKVWRGLCRRLEALGIIDEIDQSKLLRYCVYWCRWMSMVQTIRDEGITSEVAKVEDALSRIEQQFGMSPSARARLAMNPSPQKADKQTEEKRFFG